MIRQHSLNQLHRKNYTGNIKVIYTFVFLELYGLKHTCIHSADNNSDYYYRSPAQVPIQCTVRYASNTRA